MAEDDRGQKITASGGSAINTAVFVQNANQLRKLLSPEYCSIGKTRNFQKSLSCSLLPIARKSFESLIEYMQYQSDIASGNITRALKWIQGDQQKPNECDPFSERRSPHQLAIILLFISIALQLG